MSCCASSKHQFNIVGAHGFLRKYFAFILCSFPPVLSKYLKFSSTITGRYFDNRVPIYLRWSFSRK